MFATEVRIDNQNVGLKYYDPIEQANMPFGMKEFVVVATRTCITGYSNSLQSFIKSNLIWNLRGQELRLKDKDDNVLLSGLYNDIKYTKKDAENKKSKKGTIAEFEAKFTNTIYFVTPGEPDLYFINLSAGKLKSWIDADIDTKESVVGISFEQKEFTNKEGEVIKYAAINFKE